MFVFNPWLIAAGVFALIGLLDAAKEKPKGPAGKDGKAGKEGAAGKAGEAGKTGEAGKEGKTGKQGPGADG